MTLKRRLIGSFGATMLGPIVTFAVQLINVPVMLAYWGPELYGEWLIITAIPTYLLLTDMGFGNVAGSDMTIRIHAGDRAGANETFQSTAALVLITSAVIGILAGSLCLAGPIRQMLHLTTLSDSEARRTLLLLCINCLVILQWSVITAGYRSSGYYARAMVYVNITRIVEAASFLIVILNHARPSQLAAVMLVVSLLGTTWMLYDLRRLDPELAIGFRLANRRRIRELARPAFAFMAFPAGSALTTQGITLTVGIVLGPTAVALFNPMRTLARTALQFTDAVKNSVWPELSAAYGRFDWNLARKLHRTACQLSAIMAVVVLILLALAGPRVFLLWTHGRVSFNRAAFNILLLSVLANSAWNASSSVALSANKHERLSLLYLTASSVSIGLAIPLLHRVGLPGAPLAMLFADLAMAAYVIRHSNQLLSDDWASFSKSMLDFESIWSMVRKMMPANR